MLTCKTTTILAAMLASIKSYCAYQIPNNYKILEIFSLTKNYYIEEFSHGYIYGYNEKEEQYERKKQKRNVRIPFLHFLAKFKRILCWGRKR